MKTSELIEKLQALQSAHGDLPVCIVGYLGQTRIDRSVYKVEPSECFARVSLHKYPERVVHIAISH